MPTLFVSTHNSEDFQQSSAGVMVAELFGVSMIVMGKLLHVVKVSELAKKMFTSIAIQTACCTSDGVTARTKFRNAVVGPGERI